MLVAAKQLSRKRVRSSGDVLYFDSRTQTYAANTGAMVKFFTEGTNVGTVEEEVRNTRSVIESGVLTPAIKEYVLEEINGFRVGLELDRVDGEILDIIINRDVVNIGRYLKILVDTQRAFHAISSGHELPNQEDHFCIGIKKASSLSLKARRSVIDLVKDLPDGKKICHGDSHPGNVLVTKEEPVALSWVDAYRGNPFSDVARTELVFLIDQAKSSFLHRLACRYTSSSYRKEYFKQARCDDEEYRSWMTVNAAYRLREKLSGNQSRVLKRIVRKGIGIE